MRPVRGQLLHMLQTVANALGDDLRGRLVFVGGCTTALFITDEITLEGVRMTDDVDLIVNLAGYSDWPKLQDQLRDRGFTEAQDEVICRMRLDGLKVDFMPDDPKILGFTNRWYAMGIESAISYALTDALNIKILTPPLFVATKLEAYLGRGKGDLLASRDLEDILLIVDGRPEIVAEIQAADLDVRTFIASEIRALLEHPYFDHLIDGNIKGPEGRVGIVFKRLGMMADAGLN